MTHYNLKPLSLPSLAALQAKAKRKKLLEAVKKRRSQIAQARQNKEQNAYKTSEEYKEYQDMLTAHDRS